MGSRIYTWWLFSRKKNTYKKKHDKNDTKQVGGKSRRMISRFLKQTNQLVCPNRTLINMVLYSSGTSISPLSICSMMSEGCWPLTVQPTELELLKWNKNNVLASTEDFLDSTSKLVSVGTFTENLSDLDDLIESDVTAVLNYTLQNNPQESSHRRE